MRLVKRNAGDDATSNRMAQRFAKGLWNDDNNLDIERLGYAPQMGSQRTISQDNRTVSISNRSNEV